MILLEAIPVGESDGIGNTTAFIIGGELHPCAVGEIALKQSGVGYIRELCHGELNNISLYVGYNVCMYNKELYCTYL